MERKKSGKDIAIVKAKSGKEGDSEKTNQVGNYFDFCMKNFASLA